MVRHTYPIELQINKENSTDTGALFLDLDLSITDGIVSSNIHFNFEIVNVLFIDKDVSLSFPMVYIFRSLLVLEEYVLMLVTSTKENNFLLLSY